jgi:hypothetical protein
MPPIETDFNVSPYHDDYDETKDFYKALFQPGVSVQTRELNQIQTYMQKQIERLSDNLFFRGTIIDGCNFIFYKPHAYIKINDNLSDGVTPATPSEYEDYQISSSSSGLRGFIIGYDDGFEAQDPDLKTLYIKYTNSGNDGNTFAFSAGESLEVYAIERSVHNIVITNGGTGFSNSDSLVVTSALVVNTSGSFSNGDFINNGGSANVEIVGIDTTTLSTSGQIILSIRPRDIDLYTSTTTDVAWTFANNEAIQDTAASVTGTIEGIIGAGLEGYIRTSAIGQITSITLTNNGEGYTTAPVVTVKSDDNTSGVAALDLTAENFIANVQVSSLSSTVGDGYAFGVTEGVIYQKGYMLRSEDQKVVVSKYSTSPNNIAVGFTTVESIINSDIDPSLLDNAAGSNNAYAPGADRLKLVPQLIAINANTAEEDSEFFTLVQFSEGRAFK